MKLAIGYNEAILYTFIDEGTTEDETTIFSPGADIYNKMFDMICNGIRVSVEVSYDDGGIWLSDLGAAAGGYLSSYDGSIIIAAD